MAEALINGIISAGVCWPESIYVSDIKKERLDYLSEKYHIKTCAENKTVAEKSDCLMLCIKPQNMADALQDIKGSINTGTLIISVMAGKTVAGISAILGDAAIIRVMPNTPALIGEGASVLFANRKAGPKLNDAKRIFSSVGKAMTIEDEGLMDAVTAISGSGPAYFFLFMEELIKAAVKLGLPQDLAKQLVLQTAKGASLLAEQADKQNQTLRELRGRVTSPGGTTQKAIEMFEGKKLGQIVADAADAAYKRSREMSL